MPAAGPLLGGVLTLLRTQSGVTQDVAQNAAVVVPDAPPVVVTSSVDGEEPKDSTLAAIMSERDSSSTKSTKFLAKTPYAAELRRWDNHPNCSGPDFQVLNQDIMSQCVRKWIPAPASIRVKYETPTQYSSYHFQNNIFCGGGQEKKVASFTVGSCETDKLSGDSLQRFWVDKDGNTIPMEDVVVVPANEEFSKTKLKTSQVDSEQDDDIKMEVDNNDETNQMNVV